MDDEEKQTIKCCGCKKIFDSDLLGTEGHSYTACGGCGDGLCSSCIRRHCDRCPESHCRSCFESGDYYYCTYCGTQEDRIE